MFSNINNYTLVRQGHYDFGYTFNEPGIYTLAVDIKDIFYTLDFAKFAFDIVVDDSVFDRIGELMAILLCVYYHNHNTCNFCPSKPKDKKG